MGSAGQHALTFASAGFLVFGMAQAGLHVRYLGDWPRHMSSFVHTRWGPLWTLGLVAAGGALACLAFAVARLLPQTAEGGWVVASLGVVAACLWGMALFPTDVTDFPSTPTGYVHDFAAVTAVTLQCAAMFFASLAGRSSTTWRLATGKSLSWAGWASALGVLWSLGDLTAWWPWAAVLQRVLGAVMVGWLAMVSWRLRLELASPTAPVSIQGPQRAR